VRAPLLAIACLLACAPAVDGPSERQRTADTHDGVALEQQLAALPGVTRVEVVLHRPAADPLTVTPAAAPSLSVVAVVDDPTSVERTKTTAGRLAEAAAPGVPATIVVEVGDPRPVMAKVGPFSVEARSQRPLKAVLGAAFVAIAMLAGYVAYRQRRGSSAQ